MERKTRYTIETIGFKPMDEGIAREGLEFFYRFFQLIKNAYFHNINNKALLIPVNNFIEIVNKLIEREGSIYFQYKDNSLFFNKNRIKFSSEEFEYAMDVFKFFEERGTGSIIFKEKIKEEDVFNFLKIFIYSKVKEFNLLKEELRNLGVPISIEKLKKEEGTAKKFDLDRRLYVFITYSKAIILYENFLKEKDYTSKKNYILTKLLRIVQNFIDICKEDDNTFLSLSQIKNPEKPFPTHIINVLVLSISLGEKIGLSKNKLFELGSSVLFYDTGMAELNKRILEKAKELTPHEGIEIHEHPFYSLNNILSRKHYDLSNIYKAIVAFEHHICEDKDFSYPLDWNESHLFSKIVKICDAYDSLTTIKTYRPAYLPDEALAILVQNSNQYDKNLIKVFVNMIGWYPSGSYVLLNTNEKAIVLIGGGSKERLLKPVVEIVERREIVDLLNDAEGRYVLCSIPPEEIKESYTSLILGG